MIGHLLVASQISSLFSPSQTVSIVLRTKQTHTPLPTSTTDSDPPLEHATFSAVFHSPSTGTILLRLLHGGLIVELISLTYDVPPLRIVFPAVVLPSPSVTLFDSRELHVVAVLSNGSLFRVVVPLRQDVTLWNAFTNTNHETSREYVISKLKAGTDGALVLVQDAHSVAIGLPDGSLLRVEARRLASESEDDQWEESIYYHSTFLSSFKTLLNAGSPGGQEVISIATLQHPTELGHVWTLSRDRTLRLWTGAGCIWSKAVSHGSTTRSITPSSGSIPTPLLPRDAQRLLHVFTHNSTTYILVFIPTETSLTSGGSFQLFSTTGDSLGDSELFECSPGTIHGHLHDFVVIGGVLHTIWDHQGQATVERKDLFSGLTWERVTYPQEPELTPAYLDELLLSPGSLADRFYEAVMRPGVFSPLTLYTALNQYISACLSLPGPGNSHPPQLLTSYPSVGENIAAVVGCTVKLTKDPRTGAPQYSNYWNALKRDWEGFIARCREIERSARWPLAIGIGDPDGDILIIERERFGTIVEEDLPLHLHRFLSLSVPLTPQHSLMEVVWTLRTKLGQRAMSSLESTLIGIVHQEIAFSYADIIQDQVGRSTFRDDLDEGLESWITGRLQTIDDIESTTRAAFDIIVDFEKCVKGEEDEVELLLPPSHMEWKRALTTSYAASSIHARYELSLALLTLLFFLSDDLSHWDPSLLAETFAIFRGIAILRYASRQPAGKATPQDQEADDDVISRMRNMNVSSGRSQYAPTCSLVHRLLTQIGSTTSTRSAAHIFFDRSGLLTSVTPALATTPEIMFCERLRLLGYLEAARESLAWLPRTPGASYVLGRLWLDESRYEDAASAFESLAGSFGLESGLSPEDREPLAAVLPGEALCQSDFHFYIHVASLFKSSGIACYEVAFSQLALSVAPLDNDLTPLWYNVIHGLTELGHYEDAYNTLVSSPYDKLKRECISQLVYRMCEEHAADRLMSLNFATLADEVEDCLSFKARNADPRIRPFYSIILYTWYVSRGDHRNAAMIMYQRARKLGSLRAAPEDFLAISELQLEAYAVSINSLSLVDEKCAWFTMPISSESSFEPRKRRKLSKYIPEDRYTLGKRDTEIVELGDIRYEYALLSAQMDLIRVDPQFLLASELLYSPTSIVVRLAQASRFNTALAAAHALNVDMTDVFAHLTNLCLRLSRNPDANPGDTSDWLLTDKVSSWPGNFADRGWRYLRQSLERHDSPLTDYAYSKVTLETILAFDRSSPPPPWLVHVLEDHHSEFLVRACLRYDVLEFALETVLTLMRKSDKRIAQERPKNASATWLPYNLIDQVILAADSQADLSPRGLVLKNELRTEIVDRLKRMQTLSQFHRS